MPGGAQHFPHTVTHSRWTITHFSICRLQIRLGLDRQVPRHRVFLPGQLPTGKLNSRCSRCNKKALRKKSWQVKYCLLFQPDCSIIPTSPARKRRSAPNNSSASVEDRELTMELAILVDTESNKAPTIGKDGVVNEAQGDLFLIKFFDLNSWSFMSSKSKNWTSRSFVE